MLELLGNIVKFLWDLLGLFGPFRWVIIAVPILGVIIGIASTSAEERKKERITQEIKQLEIEIQEKQERLDNERKALQAAKEAACLPRIINNKLHIQKVDSFMKQSYEEYVAFDVETTGLDPELDAIIEIGAVRVVDGSIVDEYNTFVKPPFAIPEEASRINHITDSMVSNAPSIKDALPAFFEFVKDSVCIAHNVKFDSNFIGAAADRLGLKIKFSFADSLALAKKYWPDLYNKKLGTVAEVIGYENETPHRALGDAKTVHAIVTAAHPRAERMKLEEMYRWHLDASSIAYQEYKAANAETDLYSEKMEHAIYFLIKDCQLARDVRRYYESEGIEELKYPSFKRLAMIYEKREEYDKAIDICNQAIERGFTDDGTANGMTGRIEKLTIKRDKAAKKKLKDSNMSETQ